jgi:hypothetical protein
MNDTKQGQKLYCVIALRRSKWLKDWSLGPVNVNCSSVNINDKPESGLMLQSATCPSSWRLKISFSTKVTCKKHLLIFAALVKE